MTETTTDRPGGARGLESRIGAQFADSVDAKLRTLERELPNLARAAEILIECLRRGGKVLLFGNGGSAADAQHFAAELVSRFRRERPGLAAVALTTDTSILTAIGNDYGFERVFVRQVEALARPGDVAVAISTSGNSPNVLAACEAARARGLATIGFTGERGGALHTWVDVCLRAGSDETPRIQEVHITAAHALCEVVEQALFDAGEGRGGPGGNGSGR
jgi:D-sedoheptulose 7-phosphate isomerase